MDTQFLNPIDELVSERDSFRLKGEVTLKFDRDIESGLLNELMSGLDIDLGTTFLNMLIRNKILTMGNLYGLNGNINLQYCNSGNPILNIATREGSEDTFIDKASILDIKKAKEDFLLKKFEKNIDKLDLTLEMY